MGEEFLFIDSSKDKEYFTIIPNIIINGYSAKESGVYLYIKKRTGENPRGIFFETQLNASKNLDLSIPTYREIIKKFEQDGKIKYVGKKIFKTSPVKVYQITDIWKENINKYKKEIQKIPLSLKRDTKNNGITDTKNNGINKNPIKEKPIILDSPLRVNRKNTSFPKETYKQILDKYQELKGITLQGKEFDPLMGQIKTMLLSDRHSEDIISCMEWMSEHKFFKEIWTLKTVATKLPEFVAGNLKEDLKIPEYARRWLK